MDKTDREVIWRIEEEAGALCRLCPEKAEIAVDRTGMSIRTPMVAGITGVRFVYLYPTSRGEGKERLCYYHRKEEEGKFGLPGWGTRERRRVLRGERVNIRSQFWKKIREVGI